MNGVRRDPGGRLVALVLAGSISLWGIPLTAVAAPAVPIAQKADQAGAPRLSTGDEGGVLLNVGMIATASPEAQALRTAAGSFEGKRLHLVQFGGPIQPAWYAALEASGAEIIQYIPSFAYLIYGDSAALSRAQGLASLRWDGAYLDEYKIQPGAQAERLAKLGVQVERADFAVQLVRDAAANTETAKLIQGRASGPVRQQYDVLKYRNLVVELPMAAIEEVAARPDVVSIDRYVTPELFDERQNRIISGQLTGNAPTPGDYLAYLASQGFTQAQFTASGFVVDVTDSGIDNATTTPNHFGLRVEGDLANPGRVQYNRLQGTPNSGSTIQGCDGHGNLNAHIVAGYVPDPATLPDPSVHADASGFRYGLGVAPFAKVGSSVIFDPDSFTFPSYPDLQSRAYNDNARISTNSWGANVGGAYNTDSQAYDALVRDAQPAGSAFPVDGNQEMVLVFSAGNAGSGANTIGSPATAKNVISVGASEGVQAFGGADYCAVTDAEADSANDMIYFSSRGPTDDGRFKPEIVAPGTHISGGVFQLAASLAGTGEAAACFDAMGVCGGPSADFFPTTQEFYTASSGTSHSAPAVAGAAALVRQHFINGTIAPPSPALTKALLVNAARYMTGAGANDTLPSNAQGMGMLQIDSYFAQMAAARILRDQVPADMFTASGQQRVITGAVASSTEPFRVTLAWTDPPGATTGNAYVNNLDLEVTVGGNTYRGNVFSGANSITGGTADPRNNLESVFLPAGVSGAFSVKVIATNIAGDGVPAVGGALDQDFALVISNATEVTQPVLVAGTATLVAESCGAGNGALDPGELVTLSLCLQNMGTADTTDAVATLLPTGGVTLPSDPQSYGVLTAGGPPVCQNFDFLVDGLTCGETVTATLQVQDGAADLGSVQWTFLTGTPVTAATENFDTVTAPALPAGWTTTSESGAHAWTTSTASADTSPNATFINNPSTVALTSLVSPEIAVPTTSAPIVLSFRHSYNLEVGSTVAYDGAVLELKIGAGAFQDVVAAGGSFSAGGYTHTISSSWGNPLGGRQAWSGNSGGFVTTVVNLPASASGQTIQLRWRRGSDSSFSTTGWYVDTVSLQAGRACCVPPAAALSIGDATVVEGAAGSTTTATFTVTLSSPVATTVTVDYATADDTATTADSDYVATTNTLTFDPGVTSLPISVTVNGDDTVEPTETFFVNLTDPSGAALVDGQGTGTITNDDVPGITISDATVAEGASGATTTATFTVSLSPPAATTVTVDYATADDTATTADNDYVAATNTLTFDPGVTSLPISVTVNGDDTIEPTETFLVNLTDPSGAALVDGQGTGTITNDDFPTCTGFSIAPTSVVVPSGADSQIVTITGVPEGCVGGDWTAAGNGSWLTVDPVSGTGPGSVTVSWTANPGVPRSAEATIAGHTFTVTQGSPGVDYHTLAPCRTVDTRLPGPSTGMLDFGTTRTIPVAGVCGVPTSASSIALNLSVVGATAPGNCRLYPGTDAPPTVSTINFVTGVTRTNNAVVTLHSDGSVTAFCTGPTAGSVHVVVDVAGYFAVPDPD